jgi:hypothetical protein
MDTSHREGETYADRKVRLWEEIHKEGKEHVARVVEELRAMNHLVDYDGGSYFNIDGWPIRIEAVGEAKGGGGMFSKPEPNGRIAITVGWSSTKQVFKTRKQGFDYKEMALAALEITQADKKRGEQERKNEAARNAAYAKRDDLNDEFRFALYSSPIDIDGNGRETLKLKFTGLTVDQTRTIIEAALKCGALRDCFRDDT